MIEGSIINGKSYPLKMWMRDSRFIHFLQIYCFFTSMLIFYMWRSNYICPYKEFHGGTPQDKIPGSCWCGKDGYCMCTPSLAIDAIIEVPKEPFPMLVLVKRGVPPKGYAITGGFVDVGESIEDATIREVKEETNLDIQSMEQFHVYSNPKRDLRRHTVSAVFACKVTDTSKLKVGDDAKSVELVPMDKVLDLDLAFDHKAILFDYIQKFHPAVITEH